MRFWLSPQTIPRGVGVEFRWMTPEQIVSEATQSQPGIAAGQHGLAPIELCLSGSGDPDFMNTLDSDDPAVVRVPHQAVHRGELALDAIQSVRPAYIAFLEQTNTHALRALNWARRERGA